MLRLQLNGWLMAVAARDRLGRSALEIPSSSSSDGPSALGHSLVSLMAVTPLVVIGALGLTTDRHSSMAPGNGGTSQVSDARLIEQLAEREIEWIGVRPRCC